VKGPITESSDPLDSVGGELAALLSALFDGKSFPANGRRGRKIVGPEKLCRFSDWRTGVVKVGMETLEVSWPQECSRGARGSLMRVDLGLGGWCVGLGSGVLRDQELTSRIMHQR